MIITITVKESYNTECVFQTYQHCAGWVPHEQWLQNKSKKSWHELKHTDTHETHENRDTQRARTLTQSHTHARGVLLLLSDKSLCIDQCLCTSGGGAEGERNREEWTHVVNLFQVKKTLTHANSKSSPSIPTSPHFVYLRLLPATLSSFAPRDYLSFFFSSLHCPSFPISKRALC